MPLESATFIDGLVPTNPVGATDQKSQGDDHLRLIKSTLRSTFPGMAGRAWRSQSKSGNYTLVETDNMTLINAAANFTLGATAVATLGSGFMAMVATNSFAVTFDPNGAETVNGIATKSIPAGSLALLMCTGTTWHCAIIQRDGGFDVGTRLSFQQTSAPTGWTKETSSTYNDAALRFTTGTASTGGADGFSSHFGAGKSTNGHTLTAAELPTSIPVNDPGHAHGVSDPGHSHGETGSNVDGDFPNMQRPAYRNGGTRTVGVDGVLTLAQPSAFTGDRLFTDGSTTSVSVNAGGTNITVGGSGQSHSHVLANFNVKFVDFILATKQ